MTSDLQEFELDEENVNSEEIPGTGISAVLEVLGQAFGVVADRTAPGRGARHHTWLDTFDWRLNRVGLVLTADIRAQEMPGLE